MTYIMWFLLTVFYGIEGTIDCSRSFSRIVRNIFIQKIEPEYPKLLVDVPLDCPFNIKRDKFAKQERYKRMETVGRWTCLFCGKSFYDEPYIDKHFERKHDDKTPQDDHAICLADFCDIFRCDIVTGRVVAQYWDRALCKENEFSKLMEKCQHILNSCVPKNLDAAQQSQLFDLMNRTVCSYLTCASYWDSAENEVSPAYTALYITAAVFFLFGSLIYYFVAYSHFYTDESLLDGPHHHSRPYGSKGMRTSRDANVRYRSNMNSKEIW